jgi:hypothetical protein
MPTKRERRPTMVECLDNGHRFTADVLHVGHTVEEGGPGDIVWVVETTEDRRCACGSRVVVVKDKSAARPRPRCLMYAPR